MSCGPLANKKQQGGDSKKKKKVREKRGRELEVKLGGVEGGVSNETREKCGGQRNLDKTERKQRKEKV